MINLNVRIKTLILRLVQMLCIIIAVITLFSPFPVELKEIVYAVKQGAGRTTLSHEETYMLMNLFAFAGRYSSDFEWPTIITVILSLGAVIVSFRTDAAFFSQKSELSRNTKIIGWILAFLPFAACGCAILEQFVNYWAQIDFELLSGIFWGDHVGAELKMRAYPELISTAILCLSACVCHIVAERMKAKHVATETVEAVTEE